LQTAWNDPRHGLVAVAHQHLFTVPDELNMGTKLRFQIADIDGSHVSILADVTKLVIGRKPRGLHVVSEATFWHRANDRVGVRMRIKRLSFIVRAVDARQDCSSFRLAVSAKPTGRVIRAAASIFVFKILKIKTLYGQARNDLSFYQLWSII
jgi:hypothetical protein